MSLFVLSSTSSSVISVATSYIVYIQRDVCVCVLFCFVFFLPHLSFHIFTELFGLSNSELSLVWLSLASFV